MLLYLWMITQVICENLPISSSGHVVLLQQIFDKYQFGVNHVEVLQLGQYLWAFDYVLQGVSAIVFLFYFFPLWWKLIVNKPVQITSLWDLNLWKSRILPVFLFGFVADGVTFLLWSYDFVHKIEFPLSFGFLITAGALWSIQFAREKKGINIWSLRSGLIVGFVQGCALLPGVSRFATTVAVFQWLGYKGRIAFIVSFLLQWPLIAAGSIKGLCCLQDTLVLKIVYTLPFFMALLVTGFIGYKLLHCIEKIINKNLLWKFSYYMILPTIVALLV